MTPRAGQSLGGRPVTETVTPVNVGNQPHCDNGEGVATASPLPSRLKGGIPRYRLLQSSVPRASALILFDMCVSPFNRPLHGLRSCFPYDPSDKSLGYYHSSAARTGRITFCARPLKQDFGSQLCLVHCRCPLARAAPWHSFCPSREVSQVSVR